MLLLLLLYLYNYLIGLYEEYSLQNTEVLQMLNHSSQLKSAIVFAEIVILLSQGIFIILYNKHISRRIVLYLCLFI